MSAKQNPFNKLTPAEAERLALLIEECGEVIQAACKVLRHGYDSFHPVSREDNRSGLEREIGDLRAALTLMNDAGDTNPQNVNEHRAEKLQYIGKYLHHQAGE